MKKAISIILSIIMIIALMPITAYAENGPSMAYEIMDDEQYYFAYVYVTEPDENGDYFGKWGQPVGKNYMVFANNKADNEAYEGITYNRETNELTIDDGVKNCRISTFLMGDDFTIRVDGRASVDQIMISSGTYGGNLDIKGNGELTVNEAKKFPNAIVMNQSGETEGGLRFGSDVQVKLYANDDGAVVVTNNSSNSDSDNAYVFEKETDVETTQSAYSYEEPESINAIYLADPTEYRWAGWLYENENDPDGFYVGGTETDEETGETLYTLGRYVYVPMYDAYVRDYSFGDRYANGYEYAFTEEEWNAMTEYTPVVMSSDELAQVEYYDKDDLDSEGYYVATKLLRASDPDGIYGFNEYSEKENGEITFEGLRISRFVYAEGTEKLIEDETFDTLYLTWDELYESGDWDTEYGTVNVGLQWTGTLVTSDNSTVYTDGNGNNYITDYEGNAYTFQEAGVTVGDTYYQFTELAEDVNADDLEVVFNTVIEEGAYNYSIPLKELFYNVSEEHKHTWDDGVVTQPTCTKGGYTTYTCTECGETKVEDETAALGHDMEIDEVGRAATCTEDGNLPYCHCKRCDKYFIDSEGENEIDGLPVIKASGHKWDGGKVTKKASLTDDGEITYTCENCPETKKETIARVKTSTLSTKAYTYNGKEKKPTVTVKDRKGKALKNGTDFTVKYTNNINAGTASATITLKGKYSGSKTLKYTINKAAQPMTASAKTKSKDVSYTTVKSKDRTFKKTELFKIEKAQGSVTFSKSNGDSKIIISKSGNLTVKKGIKKGTYNVKIKVKAAGNKNYLSGSKLVTVKLVVK